MFSCHFTQIDVLTGAFLFSWQDLLYCFFSSALFELSLADTNTRLVLARSDNQQTK